MQQFIKCLLAVLLLLLASANATVTIIETGQSYATRPDNSGLGKEFYSGYEYMGRLQWIHGNLPLCDDSQIYNVTVPYDGLFVALVVRGGGCSLQQKLKVATNNIHPAGVVKYMLIDGKNPDEEIVYSNDNNYNNEYMQDFRYTENDESVIIFDPDDDTDSTLSHKKHSARKSDDIIPAFSIYILHISYKTEYALLDRLLKQSQESFTDGGPRIALDSRLGTGIWNGPLAVWMALCIFVSACACSCLVILGNESINFEHDQMPPRPPVRRERPRLSRDQIRQRLPVYQYPHEAGPLLAEDVENNNTNNQELVVPPLSNELELCTICLDEYEPGDRLRCLPCRHVFHANCIGKWLHERSATCPLCKIDLWEEEEEESDDEEEVSLVEGHEARPQVIDDNTASQQQSWWSAIFWRPPAASTTTTTPEQEMTETHSDTAVEQQQQQQSEEDFPRGSWWRRMFPVSNTTTETRASLTEPLLSLQEEVVEREDSNGNEEVTQNEEACTGDADEEVTLQPGQVLV